jgi:hypothetical protein
MGRLNLASTQRQPQGADAPQCGTVGLRIGSKWIARRGLDRTAEVRELSEMSKGYWVAFADVSDAEGYKVYIAENAKAFRKYGARFLIRGGAYEAPEGKPV